MAAPPSSLGLRFDASSSAAIKQEPPPPEISFDDLILRDQCGPDDMLDARAPTGFFRPTNSFYPPPSYYPSEFPSLSIATELSPSTDGSLNGSQMHSSISPDTSPHHQLLPAAEGDPPPRLLILGIPDEGTRTRVETQIRITLMLVQPLTHDNVRLTTPSGQLLPSIRDHAVKLAQWKYLKLPGYTAIKRKHKKYQKSDATTEDTLYLECQVLRSQEPREVFICTNCNERERKRTQRKKDARLRPTEDIETDGSNTTSNTATADYDRRKIILFNCGEFLDFTEGEVSMPCRIACYCRHHKEKDGFTVAIQLKDHQGSLVASAVSPRIFTTDDHKARARPRPGYSGESSTNVSRDTSHEDLSALLEQGIQVVGKHAKKPSLASLRSRSSQSIHEDASTARGRTRADKPYERKRRSGSLSRASMFSMTPLDGRSRRNSPDSPTVPLPPDTVINTISTDPFPPGDAVPEFPYSLAPPSPAYSITTSLNDAFSAQALMQRSPTLDSYEQPSLGSHLSPMMRQMPEPQRVVPAEGGLSGGYQVTILGSNFTPDCICHFGGVEAITTQYFSDTTLICSVPPGMAPGPVPLTIATSTHLSPASSCTFTYVNSEHALLEIALQIVGFKLTGRYDHARSIARQIVDANSPQAGQQPMQMPSGMTAPYVPYHMAQAVAGWRAKRSGGWSTRLQQWSSAALLGSVGRLQQCLVY